MLSYLPIELTLKILSHIDSIDSMYKLLSGIKFLSLDKKIARAIIEEAQTDNIIQKLKEIGENKKAHTLRRRTLYSIIGFYPSEKLSTKILQDTIQTKYNPELIRIHCTKMNKNEKHTTMRNISKMLQDPKSGVLTKIECLKMFKIYNAYQYINDISKFIDNKSLNIHDYNLVSPIAMDSLSYLSNKFNIKKEYYKDTINNLFKNSYKQSPQFLVGILISLFNYNCQKSLLFKKIVDFIGTHYPYHHVYHPNIIPSEELIKEYDLQSNTSIMGGPYPSDMIDN